MWYGQLTDLRKRLGEVRYGTQTGLWVRGFAVNHALMDLEEQVSRRICLEAP